MQSYDTLLQRIEEYKKRYFLNQLVKGSLFFVALSGSLYLLLNTAEFVGRFGSSGRAIMFFGFLLTVAITLYLFIIKPLYGLYTLKKALPDDEAARQIGQFFPEVGDKLLNTLQLQRLSSAQSDLMQASLQQRSQQLLITRFANAIQINRNRRFLKFALPPLLLIAGILLVNPTFFSASSKRIVNYNREFAEEAPFQFLLQNKSLKAFRNEDFPLTVRLTGSAIPQDVYLVTNETRFKLEPSNGLFTYTFDNVQRDLDFHLEASGFRSADYQVELIDRPAVLNFDVKLVYPAYLNKPSEQLSNVGNLLVPQGTVVTWNFVADHTDSLLLQFGIGAKPVVAQLSDDNQFTASRRLMQNMPLTVTLKNNQVPTPSAINYAIQVIPDRFPSISVDKIQDTVAYSAIALNGLISDDYGFTKLRLNYKVIRKGKESPLFSKDIPINRSSTSQNFAYNWSLDSLKLDKEDRLDYFVQVWDNDGANGAKSARSNPMNFAVPSNQDVQKQIDKAAEKTEEQLDQALSKTQEIKKELAQMEDRLRTKKATDFQDKKQLEDVLKKREELIEQIKQLQEQFQKTNQTQERFAQTDPQMQQKMEQLEKMFKDLLDPESKKLYDELKQLLEKKQDDKASEVLDRLNRKERNMQRDLERAMKMFKQMQLEQKVENAINELEKQAEKQDKEAEENSKEENSKNADKNSPKDKEKQGTEKEQQAKDQEQQAKEQEKAIEDFKKLQEQLKEIEKQAEKDQLRSPEQQEESQKEIEQQMQQSKQSLDQKQSQKASKSQSKTSKSMRSMAKAMQMSMASMEAQELQENMDDLRNLLENLITLSFGQERLMKEFRGINLQDPRVAKLSQDQLKLQDDARIVEDSLTSLASRVNQIQSFVTREMSNMKYYMDQSTQQLKERKLSQASSRQQFAMTSMNNLALLLSDVLKNMQQQMNGMGMPGSGQSKGKSNNPSGAMGEMQKQLNAKMRQMSQGGTTGRAQSEQMAQMAAEQAMIRGLLKKLQENAKGTEVGKQLEKQVGELMEKMDQTETDLVNKRVNPNTINRQNEILTRLLESEKALKQQEEDPQRQSQTAKSPKVSNPSFFDSLNNRPQMKQAEVLRSVLPTYNPYYKKQANEYLQKVSK
ncbi:MAG: ATPase [Cytophagales bacterium]|nr:MAG: ATPase [Cytophagales bacterium]